MAYSKRIKWYNFLHWKTKAYDFSDAEINHLAVFPSELKIGILGTEENRDKQYKDFLKQKTDVIYLGGEIAKVPNKLTIKDSKKFAETFMIGLKNTPTEFQRTMGPTLVPVRFDSALPMTFGCAVTDTVATTPDNVSVFVLSLWIFPEGDKMIRFNYSYAFYKELSESLIKNRLQSTITCFVSNLFSFA